MILTTLGVLACLGITGFLTWERDQDCRAAIEGSLGRMHATDISISRDWLDFDRDTFTYDVQYRDGAGKLYRNRCKVSSRDHLADDGVYWVDPIDSSGSQRKVARGFNRISRVSRTAVPAGDPSEASLHACEAALRQAQLTSNVQELDRLVDDSLVFTGPTGAVYSKADDLEAHRRGMVQITRLEPSEEQIQRFGHIAVVSVRMEMSGTFAGEPFAGPFRYTRVWRAQADGWRIVAGHVSAVLA